MFLFFFYNLYIFSIQKYIIWNRELMHKERIGRNYHVHPLPDVL